MDPLSISASAVALITVCIEAVQIIKKTIETIKGAKAELLNVLNETNQTRLLLEQLRALTHQLSCRDNRVLLQFDKTDCENILQNLIRLIMKLAGAGKLVGFQFLINKSKFEALARRLEVQRDRIHEVLLSITTESAVFTREFVQTLIDGTNVQAMSISSMVHRPAIATTEPARAADYDGNPPQYTDLPDEKAEIVSDARHATECDLLQNEVIPGDNPQAHILDIGEDKISVIKSNSSSASMILDQAEILTHTELQNARKEDHAARLPTERHQSGYHETADSSITPSYVPKAHSMTAIWHGQLSRACYDTEELALRDGLADAAYQGAWDDVFAIIDDAAEKGLRSWPNCYRLKTSNLISGWTPLHQAAFLTAPRQVVETLVEKGASRSLRTIWASPSELPYKNMTALEIAEFMGSKHLYDILSPVIRHHVPHTTMHRIQQNFHDLIREDLADRPEYARLRLPELDLLTELENPEVFFPLRSQKITMGYFYRLDGRELLVASLGVVSSRENVYYRITERYIREIEDAILFEMA